MEKYIRKIKDKIELKPEEKQLKAKKKYLYIGIPILTLGAIGFLASFITFLVLFFKGETTAFTFWLIAIPFIAVFTAGAVVARIGDVLVYREARAQRWSARKEKRKEARAQKKAEKSNREE